MLELSGLFVCPGGLAHFFSASGERKNAGLWFAREGEGGGGVSTQADTMGML